MNPLAGRGKTLIGQPERHGAFEGGDLDDDGAIDPEADQVAAEGIALVGLEDGEEAIAVLRQGRDVGFAIRPGEPLADGVEHGPGRRQRLDRRVGNTANEPQ